MTIKFQDLAEVLTEARDPEGNKILVSPDDLDQLEDLYAKARSQEGLPGEDDEDVS